MKDTKQKYYFSKILEYLLNADKVTIDEISENVKISEKTARTKINDINNYLRTENLGKIVKKPRVGIWLECNKEQRAGIRAFITNDDLIDTIQVSDERLYDVLRYLFRYRNREIITTSRIAQSLYLSTPTILKILKQCEEWLQQYNIELQNTRNKGIIMIFNENGYRRAVQKLILHGNGVKNIDRNIMNLLPLVRTDLVRKAILDTEKEWQFEFFDDSFYEILVYCCVAVERGNKGTIHLDEKDLPIIERYNEFLFAKSIFKNLQKIYNIKFNENEVYLLAIQIICSKYLEDNEVDSYEEAIHETESQLNRFTDELISMVSNILDSDLTHDNILRDSLILHLQSTIFRMKYSNLMSNSLIFYIKKKYKNVFRATWSVSILFEKYFGFKITEDELGYICLYIQAALERKKNAIRVLVITNHSRSASQLTKQRIKNAITSVDKVKVVSEHDIDERIFNEYDIIVTTKDLKIKNKPVLKINDILQDSWMMDLMTLISNEQYRLCKEEGVFDPHAQKLFDPEIITTGMEFKTKNEVIAHLSMKLFKKGYVTKDFFNTVIDRENVTSTEIGNGIALPHGNQNCVISPKVAMCILNKPIIWDKEEVNVIFLLAVRMKTPDEIRQTQMFYKQFISFVDTEEKLKRLVSFKTEIELYQYLIR